MNSAHNRPLRNCHNPKSGGEQVPLSNINPGFTALIESISGDHLFRSRLRNMGLREGNQIKVIKQAPLSDPMEYQVGATHLSLRREEAEQILVILINN